MNPPYLTTEQWDQLSRIPPARDEVEYYPSRLRMKDGRVLDRVIVLPSTACTFDWPPRSRILFVENVLEFQESPYRIPPELARKAYSRGESGMGYYIFTLVLSDGRRLPYVTGNTIDFVNLPDGVDSSMIANLLLDVGREEINRRHGDRRVGEADCYWCPFAKPAGT